MRATILKRLEWRLYFKVHQVLKLACNFRALKFSVLFWRASDHGVFYLGIFVLTAVSLAMISFCFQSLQFSFKSSFVQPGVSKGHYFIMI